MPTNLAEQLLAADMILAVQTSSTATMLILIDFVAASRNSLRGGSGNDALFGGAAHDQIDGGNGRDVIVGGLGDDDLRGGYGTDLIVGDDASNSVLLAFLARISSGVRITGDISNRTGLLQLAAEGSLLLPDAWVSAQTSACAADGSPLGQAIFGASLPAFGRAAFAGGEAIEAILAMTDRPAGNDVIVGGPDDDVIVGDNLTVASEPVAGTQRPAIRRLSEGLGALFRQFERLAADAGEAHHVGNSLRQALRPSSVNEASDAIWGGRGDDLVVGDDAWFVVPVRMATAGNGEVVMQLEDVASDLSNLVERAHGPLIAVLRDAAALKPAARISIGVDRIDAAPSTTIFGTRDEDRVVPSSVLFVATPPVAVVVEPVAETSGCASGIANDMVFLDEFDIFNTTPRETVPKLLAN